MMRDYTVQVFVMAFVLTFGGMTAYFRLKNSAPKEFVQTPTPTPTPIAGAPPMCDVLATSADEIVTLACDGSVWASHRTADGEWTALRMVGTDMEVEYGR